MTKLCVVAAGGTGGHMFPAEALAREMAARGWRVVLATDHRGEQYAHAFPAEERLALDAATGSGPIGMLKAGLAIWRGVGQAKSAFDRTGADVVKMLLRMNAEAGTTLVLVTHDASLAARCDRSLHLDGGRLVDA